MIVAEDYACFPDVGAVGGRDVFDAFVLFDDEAGQDSFGHEAFVVVAEAEIAGDGGPGVVGSVLGKEVGGDVVTGAAGDFVADFEFEHELQEFVAHVLVLVFVPDFVEVLVVEVAEGLGFDPSVVEDFVEGGGGPVGF